MKRHFMAMALVCAMILGLTACVGALAEAESAGDTPDYSNEDCWLQHLIGGRYEEIAGIGDGVVHMDELNVKAPQSDMIAGILLDELGRSG